MRYKEKEFQFYLSSIKSNNVVRYIKTEVQFQFYLSSIKRIEECDGIGESDLFQFYLSSIKSYRLERFTGSSRSFNSTLVQLKDRFSLCRKGCQHCFNSTLVQLKAVKNANKYTSKSMIYHTFILIFYKHLQSTFNSLIYPDLRQQLLNYSFSTCQRTIIPFLL